MSKSVMRLLAVMVASSTVVSELHGPVAGGATQDPKRRVPSHDARDGDVFSGAIKRQIEKLVKSFEMKDEMEIALFFSGLEAAKDLRLERGSVVSLSIVRNGAISGVSRACEETVGDRWTIRFRRMTGPDMKAPLAIITNAYSLNGQIIVRENALRFDPQTAKWYLLLSEK